METNETEQEKDYPPSPPIPNDHEVYDNDFADPFEQAIRKEQGSPAKNELDDDYSYRTTEPSLKSDFETGRQNPTLNEFNTKNWKRGHERLSSFVSSSSSNTAFDRGVLSTSHSLQFDSSPERESKHSYSHVYDNGDDVEEIPSRREQETLNPLIYNADYAHEISNSYSGNRQRTSSDDFYLFMKSESHNTSGLKFYESDVDSVNGSVVYRRNSLTRTNRRLSGGDSDADYAPVTRGAWHAAPSQNINKKAIASKKRGEPKLGDGYELDESTGIGIDTNAVDLAVLPYQARKQLKERNNVTEFHSNNPNDGGQVYGSKSHEQSQLSTIAAPFIPKSSPTYAYSSGLPPSGPRRSRSFSKDAPHVAEDRMNLQQIHHDETSKRNDRQLNEGGETEAPLLHMIQRPPPLHFRLESSGSVSSLGSTMDGASSMAQHDTERLSMKLDRDIQHYHDDNNNDSEFFPSRGGPGKRLDKKSAGFLSHLVDSMSFTSAGSFKSVEDELADYRKKGTKFLKKAEKLKKNLNSGPRGWLQDFVGDRTNLRSVSPANRSQRSHRPRLPSIDNDTWEEDDGGDDDDQRVLESKRNRKSTIIMKGKHYNGKPPVRKKAAPSNYGSVNGANNFNQSDNRYSSNHNRDRYGMLRKDQEPYSESDESDESYMSSGDLSNNELEGNSEDSSVYVGENNSHSDGCLSFDEDNHEKSSLLPSGIKTYESGYPGRDHGLTKANRSGRKASKPSKRMSNQNYLNARRGRNSNRRGYSSRSRKKRHHDLGRPFSEYDPNYEDHNFFPSNEYQYSDRHGHTFFYEEERRKMEHQIRKQMIKEFEEQQCCNRFNRWYKSVLVTISKRIEDIRCETETFIGNLPLTIGAIALAIVTLGVVWFKFAEVMLDTCKPVHFHSTQCNFPEFPGCFYCDTEVRGYKIAYAFHQACSALAGAIAFLFILKICIARRKVVIDEMNSPTTSSPAGLICMTIVCVAAGKGMLGKVLVTSAAGLHFCVAVWFILMAGSFNILPDPSWYPNTVGIGVSAVKTWLYYPMLGHFLMLISLSFFSFFFPISLVRVTLNQKISAPVAWIQMSAPAVSLYAMTIMAQPSFEEEYPDINEYQKIQRLIYLPCMHLLFIAALVGVISSVQSLYTRWDSFRKVEFSPAHAAFCFPTLAHANAVQAYRGAIHSFSALPPTSVSRVLLDIYWLIVLIAGTILTVVITIKFFYRLPGWTRVNLEGENEPPAPNETLMSEVVRVGETWRQNYVSPVVLQANEAGALVQVRKNGRTKYVRTRRVTALGFEPIMDMIDFTNEREALLEWVERNPPRTRKRTMSVPGFGLNLGDFGSHNRGIYTGGTGGGYLPTHHASSSRGLNSSISNSSSDRRQRAQTLL
eukprot:CAMPEP_0176484188 /NCGR_PEP_ID=MMETSP0200_2-20121128/4321_1 /TAXON_ID=947934 /ORGANISM="Chaetoceros sp., Strain GSL56" /LENGTH=1370 /DNA_ID=CAMNT_0017880645 /DNA_START=72 /DNA_END=4187 /DNA_ORIENTATION=-